jgi:protease I
MTLKGRRVAILVAEGFEQSEMVEPRKALEQAGAETSIVSPAKGEVQGWNHFDKADRFNVDVPIEAADADDYDALLLPPWTLIEAGVVKGRTITSWPSLKTDLVNAGAKWVDQEVVTDKGLVSSRKPADIPAFSRKLIEEIGEAQHAPGRRAAA